MLARPVRSSGEYPYGNLIIEPAFNPYAAGD